MLCVLNAVPPRGPREGQARALLADFGIPVAAPRLGQRAAVDYAAAVGRSAAEHDPRGRAAEEVAAIFAAVGRLAGLTPARPGSPRWRVRLICAARSSTRRRAATPGPLRSPSRPRAGRGLRPRLRARARRA